MILNRQKRIPIHQPKLERFLATVRKELKLGRREVTVCFVDDREIARLNRRFRGKPKATDVLSFPADGDGHGEFPVEGNNYLGDIAISPEAAKRNARRFGRTLEDELRVLILHGVLHLAGYDHETDQGEMDMLEKLLRRRMDVG